MALQRISGRFMGVAVVGVPLLAAGLVWAIPARADEAAYITDMHNAGVASSKGDSDLLQTGWQVCSMLTSGTSPDDVKARLFYNSDSSQGSGGITSDQANAIVNSAMTDLCPSA